MNRCTSKNHLSSSNILTILKKIIYLTFKIPTLLNKNINNWRLNLKKRRTNYKTPLKVIKNKRNCWKNSWFNLTIRSSFWKRKKNRIVSSTKKIIKISRLLSLSNMIALDKSLDLEEKVPTCLNYSPKVLNLSLFSQYTFIYLGNRNMHGKVVVKVSLVLSLKSKWYQEAGKKFFI